MAYISRFILVHTLIYTTFVNKIPNIYLFIFMGFLIDLFLAILHSIHNNLFSCGAISKFFEFKVDSKITLEQLILIISISFCLNILLFYVNDFPDEMSKRIFINPFLNSMIWVLIFINQRHKWLKNI